MSALPPGAAGRLTVRLEGNVVATVELNEPIIKIGRTPDNGLPLPHPMVSRQHAELRLADEGAVLTDVGSTHGTFVEGVRLLEHQPRLLRDGETVTVGPFMLTYQAPAMGRPAEDAAEVMVPIATAPSAPVVVAIAPPPAPPQPPRPRLPIGAPPPGQSAYLRDLPVVYHESDFLGRFLQIFETIWEPLEHRQARIEMYIDPTTAPATFLPWLASWLDLPTNRHWPEARLRQLIAEAMDLHRWRGTRYGLARMIEIHTGLYPAIGESLEQPHVFHLRLAVPAGMSIDRELVEELIHTHKPAHTGFVLEVIQ